jgi:dual specificity MAP kinase phosphatase
MWNATAVLPYIFVGSAQDAKNLVALKAAGITHILNVADNVKNHHPTEFVYENLQVKDRNDDEGVSRVFQRAREFVEISHQSGGKVLVHCMMGQNRSVAVVMGILLQLHPEWNLKECYANVLKLRPWIALTDVNRNELLQFEKKTRNGVVSMTWKDW